MRYLKQLGIILFVSFLGEGLNRLIPLPVPGSVYGILLMLLCLQTGLIPLEAVRETGRFLVEIMPVMFIAPSVGLMTAWDAIRAEWVPYLLIPAITTILVMAAAGCSTQAILRRERHRAEKEENHD